MVVGVTGRTGYEIREGSAILAQRFRITEHDRQVAEAMLRRWRIAFLARKALRLLEGRV